MDLFNYFLNQRKLFWENSSTMSASCEGNFSHHKKRKINNKGKRKHLKTMLELTNTLFIVPEMLNEYLQLLHKMA